MGDERDIYPKELWAGLHETMPDRFPAPTTSEANLATAVAIRRKYSLLIVAAAGGYSPEERETWPMQSEEARIWQRDATVPTPLLTAIAASRGISVAALAEKILVNDTAFRQTVGSLLGAQQKELDQLG